MRRIHLTGLAALAVLGIAPAHAADFTFEVPVEISNVPAEVTHMAVYCQAKKYEDPRNLDYHSPVGISISVGRSYPLPEHRYSGVVRLEVNATAGRRPQEANGYECRLVFQVMEGTTLVRSYEYDTLTTQYPPAAGSTPVVRVRAIFPPAAR
jgi:hypothetical protein